MDNGRFLDPALTTVLRQKGLDVQALEKLSYDSLLKAIQFMAQIGVEIYDQDEQTFWNLISTLVATGSI